MGITAATKTVFTGLTLTATLTGTPVAFADQPVQTPAQKEMAALLNVYKQQLEKNTDSLTGFDLATAADNITKIGKHCGTLATPAINLLAKIDNISSIEGLGEVAAQCPEAAKKTMGLIASFEKGHSHPSPEIKNWERRAVAVAAVNIAVNYDDAGLDDSAMSILEKTTDIFANDTNKLASSDSSVVNVHGAFGVEYDDWPAENKVGLMSAGEEIANSLTNLGMRSTPMAARAHFALGKMEAALKKAPRATSVISLLNKIESSQERLNQYLQTIPAGPERKNICPS
ncbi:MAG TPA: hypothetical protein VIF12_01330 [Micavibrio sp.]|jgi:uncharacterized protein (DUF697 family)